MRLPARKERPLDYPLLGLILLLLGFGCVMLYSASAILADQGRGDSLYFIKRQALYCAAGLGLMALLSKIHYSRLREWVWSFMVLTLFLLAAVLFTEPIAEVHRWIRLGPVNIQPSELAKLSLLLFLADYLDRKRSKVSTLAQGTIVPWTIVALVLGLIAAGKDLGTPALLFAVAAMLLFIGGSSVYALAGTLACAAPVFALLVYAEPYRVRRVLNFLAPFDDARGAGYQLTQAILAVGSGGWLGKGLGASKLKLLHLPAPHTDFIFPVLCEELGLIGALMLLALFAAFLARGVRAASAAPDLFGALLASGLTFLITLQALLNVAMSIGLLPTKGLPLPFFSYGGSSLVVSLACAGILLNISRHGPEQRGS